SLTQGGFRFQCSGFSPETRNLTPESFIAAPPISLALPCRRTGRCGPGWNIAFPNLIAVLVADLHVSRQREQSERQEKHRDSPLESFKQYARSIGLVALEPAPLDPQPT